MLRPYISVASVAIAPNAPTANLTSVTTQQMICPGCRAEIPLGSAFCPACGNPSPTVITNERVAAPPPRSPAPEGSGGQGVRPTAERLARALGPKYQVKRMEGRGGGAEDHALVDHELRRPRA